MRCIQKQSRLTANPRTRWLSAPALGFVLAAGLALAACGSPSAPAVATGSTTTTTAHAPTSGGGTHAGLLAYSACMRIHGVPNFPDPSSRGGVPKSAVIAALNAVSGSQSQHAQNACSHLLPAGGSLSGQPNPTVTLEQEQYYLKAAACMRAHGITNFPDPIFPGGHVELPDHGDIDEHTVQYTQANETCRKLIPAGLPDSDQGR